MEPFSDSSLNFNSLDNFSSQQPSLCDFTKLDRPTQDSYPLYNVLKIDRASEIINGRCQLIFLDLTSLPSLKSNQFIVFFPSLSTWRDQKLFFKTQVSFTNQIFTLPVYNFGRDTILKQKGEPIGFYTICNLNSNTPSFNTKDKEHVLCASTERRSNTLKNLLQSNNFQFSTLQNSLSLSQTESKLQLINQQISIDPKKELSLQFDNQSFSNDSLLIVFQDLPPYQLLNSQFPYWIPFKIITNLQSDNYIDVLNLQKFSQLDIYNSQIEDQDIKYNFAKVIQIQQKQQISFSVQI